MSKEEQLLKLVEETRQKVSNIHDEVDVHKRYDSRHVDSYGQVIEWVHETGRKILSE